jgi:hypothetical protein
VWKPENDASERGKVIRKTRNLEAAVAAAEVLNKTVSVPMVV